jgi:hypothetical protein
MPHFRAASLRSFQAQQPRLALQYRKNSFFQFIKQPIDEYATRLTGKVIAALRA